MTFHIITIFPEIFDYYMNESIIGRAIKKKLNVLRFYNPRDYVKAKNKNGYRPIDDRPYGGGPGMVMRPEPIIKAIENALKKIKSKNKVKIINFSPSGKKFETAYAKNLVKQKYNDLILICGRYEGIDARVEKIFKTENISIGDYVLTGGELPAMVVMDSISRQIKGVLGKYESLEEERISSSEVYTRPEVLEYPFGKQKSKKKKFKVPRVLLSGNHKEIENWKQKATKK